MKAHYEPEARIGAWLGVDMMQSDLAHRCAEPRHATPSVPIATIVFGWGACRSCGCRGYTKSGDGSTCGNCGHHYTQHRG